MDWELTGEQVDQLPIPRAPIWRRINDYEWRQVAKAQAKTLVGRLEEPCKEHPIGISGYGRLPGKRLHCPECIQELRQQVLGEPPTEGLVDAQREDKV